MNKIIVPFVYYCRYGMEWLLCCALGFDEETDIRLSRRLKRLAGCRSVIFMSCFDRSTTLMYDSVDERICGKRTIENVKFHDTILVL